MEDRGGGTRGTTYQGSKIVPHLRDVRVQTDGAGVCIKRVTVLIDLIVEHTNRAPECRIPAIAVDGLLVGFVRLGVLGLRHIAATQKIPALSVGVVYNVILPLVSSLLKLQFNSEAYLR